MCRFTRVPGSSLEVPGLDPSHGDILANGTYDLSVWRIDFEPVTMKIEVDADTDIDVGVEPRRVVDEDEKRMWM